MILNTILYDGNYRELLDESGWFLNYKSPVIKRKLITVNNVASRGYIEDLLQKCKAEHDNVDYIFVSDYEQAAISHFGLDINKDTTQGYYYIIPYFALILHLKEGYVFNVSDDCMKDIRFDDSFLIQSMAEMNTNPQIPVTTLGWGPPKQSFGYDVGEWEQIATFRLKNKVEPDMADFWYSVGFVDQVFVGDIAKLMKMDYNIATYDNPIYHGPWYCPNSWERRVAENMYHNNQYRGVWKKSEHYYMHPGHKL